MKGFKATGGKTIYLTEGLIPSWGFMLTALKYKNK